MHHDDAGMASQALPRLRKRFLNFEPVLQTQELFVDDEEHLQIAVHAYMVAGYASSRAILTIATSIALFATHKESRMCRAAPRPYIGGREDPGPAFETQKWVLCMQCVEIRSFSDALNRDATQSLHVFFVHETRNKWKGGKDETFILVKYCEHTSRC